MTNDLDLKTLYDYLKEGNYTQLPGNVKEAAYRISVDPKYADLANNEMVKPVLGWMVMKENMEDHTSLESEDFDNATKEVAKYLKEDEFSKEQYDFDNALDPDKKEELERIIIKYREQYGINTDLSEIKNNIIRYSEDREAIDLENDEPYSSFYHDCVSEYIGEKREQYDKKNVYTFENKVTKPEIEKKDLDEAGYVNLLFAAIILTAIAFFILFKIF